MFSQESPYQRFFTPTSELSDPRCITSPRSITTITRHWSPSIGGADAWSESRAPSATRDTIEQQPRSRVHAFRPEGVPACDQALVTPKPTRRRAPRYSLAVDARTTSERPASSICPEMMRFGAVLAVSSSTAHVSAPGNSKVSAPTKRSRSRSRLGLVPRPPVHLSCPSRGRSSACHRGGAR